MSSRVSSLRFAALAFLFVTSGAAHAQSEPPSQWGLGATVGQERQPYRDFDHKAQLLPLILFENRWVRVAGPSADLSLVRGTGWAAGLRLRYAGEGYEADDSPALQGMAERKAGVWLGGSARWDLPWLTISGEVLGDAANDSQGLRASLGAERRINAGGGIDVTPRLVAHHLDRKYVEYYYGVTAAEARAARPAYAGSSTTNLEAGLRIGYALAPRQRLSLDVSSTRLGSGIKDSPLVDRSRQDSARISYLYLF